MSNDHVTLAASLMHFDSHLRHTQDIYVIFTPVYNRLAESLLETDSFCHSDCFEEEMSLKSSSEDKNNLSINRRAVKT